MPAVTFTVTVQEVLAGIDEPADRVTVEVPGPAVIWPPPQVLPALEGLATTKPGGRVSISAELRMATVEVSGLLKVMVSFEVLPALMVAGVKALPSIGAATSGVTVKVAKPGVALLPLVVSKALAASELT